MRNAIHSLVLAELLGVGLLQLGPAHSQVHHGPGNFSGQIFPDAIRDTSLRGDRVRVSLEPPGPSGFPGFLGNHADDGDVVVVVRVQEQHSRRMQVVERLAKVAILGTEPRRSLCEG
ncbi:hypothetical protein ACFTXM_20625 [Streptomyces sp. NPDC056930]|uniref:hypothetical protein n=1 Tax=Streptomyces sp. NPDC056930 TaxID=3345967 RepID=UPI003635F0D8